MAANPLFYSDIVPLNRETHATLTLADGPRDWSFARGSHLIPAVLDEFGAAAPHLPILFVGGQTPNPVFLVGLTPSTNAQVAEDGSWRGGYVPAFLRRYPFILGETGEPDRTVVCVDAGARDLASTGGTPLFQDGADSPELLERIKLANDYWTSARRTERLMERLAALDLLYGISIRGRVADGETTTLHGFSAVNEERLATLSDDAFLDLRREGLLGPIYAHLISLAAVERLSR